MIRPLVLLIVLSVGAAACNDDVTQFVFDARILDGDGGNPVAGTDATTLRIAIAEGDLPVRDFEYPITDGQFDATLEFASFSSPTRASRRVDAAPAARTRATARSQPSYTPSAGAPSLPKISTQ